ncbi:TolB family protein [Streptosporangium carneum]|uniref:TolB-like translocation protein signal peptide n=1 Tax=Streptosporangium carneum TaxID=47481 RepID=A0A9W6IB60_9ACTN|nr:hypothetical protein [Streptosporangium carneum]GLK14344.1 TolB-like translocation protein; signal peptide [Streptosporangium carneum]
MNARTRWIVLTVATLVLAASATAYLVFATDRAVRTEAAAALPKGEMTLSGEGLLTLDGRGTLTRQAGGSRTTLDRTCARFHAAVSTAVCMITDMGARTRYYATVLDGSLRETRRVEVPGVPSRARVSPSGNMVSWTVFVSGDSYLSSGLSTRTGILDTRTGRTVPSLEEFALYRDGRRDTSPDHNYWGVTFTGDDDHFYVTVSTKGEFYLARGSYAARRVDTVRRGVECPSLSPDQTRVAYKKRTGDASSPWRVHVLDLASGRDTALAEDHSVDDQVAWLDDGAVMYARLAGERSDVWTVPADGTGTPRKLLEDAFSPVSLGRTK